MNKLRVYRTCHARTCHECGGTGWITVNRSTANDPALDEDYRCSNPECDDGEIYEWVDPLLRLREWHANKRLPVATYRKIGGYQSLRRQALGYHAGLAQAEMLARATMCESAGTALSRSAQEAQS